MQEAATEAWPPLVNELEALAHDLSEAEREVVAHFLERAADAAARHADRVTNDADTAA